MCIMRQHESHYFIHQRQAQYDECYKEIPTCKASSRPHPSDEKKYHNKQSPKEARRMQQYGKDYNRNTASYSFSVLNTGV